MENGITNRVLVKHVQNINMVFITKILVFLMENVDMKLTKPLKIIILVIAEKTEIVYGIRNVKAENVLIYVRTLLVVGMKNAKMENA